MSSIYCGDWCHGAEKCIDGDTESDMCHTKDENAPWLAIEFSDQVDVLSVTIYNRKDCCGDRFRNAEVRVTDVLPTDGTAMFTGGQLLSTFTGPAVDGQVILFKGQEYLRGRYTWPLTLIFSTMSRFVLVQISSRIALNLHEVTVQAKTVGNYHLNYK
jgi:hypothetical protein